MKSTFSLLLICVLAGIVFASKDTHIAEYCWCNEGKDTCVATCNEEFTCNGNGKCVSGGVCKCDEKYAGEWCESCAPRVTRGKTGKCDKCVDNYYGPTCSRYCDSNTCKNGGKCSNDGSCSCKEPFTGDICTICDYDRGYMKDYNGVCVYCHDSTNCSYGYCQVRKSTKDSYCNCPPPFKGDTCRECIDPKKSYAKDFCGVASTAARKGAAADADKCKPPNLMLPVIISAIASVVIVSGALGAYMAYSKAKPDSGDYHKFSDARDDSQL